MPDPLEAPVSDPAAHLRASLGALVSDAIVVARLASEGHAARFDGYGGTDDPARFLTQDGGYSRAEDNLCDALESLTAATEAVAHLRATLEAAR